ncbi:imidazole glycerol phosphate synthase subunit HisH [Bacteriovoracales bacterium]|nr:imidazole glycerol phosphate synthase subunit HisH [Bacteriovoracales bacterium]
MKEVTIVDYGVGNLKSVANAFKSLNCKVGLAQNAKNILSSDYLIFPGVGAFHNAMEELRQRELIDAIKEFNSLERPFLGICLGLQLLFENSCEFGNHVGLSLLKGSIKEIPSQGSEGLTHKIPHIGWNNIINQSPNLHPILKGLPQRPFFYFVHSFMAVPENSSDIIAKTNYNGIQIPAIAGRNNFLATQFHPEKSGSIGLKVLSNFLKM